MRNAFEVPWFLPDLRKLYHPPHHFPKTCSRGLIYFLRLHLIFFLLHRGTGKTRTLLVAILKVLALNKASSSSQQEKNGPVYRCLVCTPSHTACDVVTRRLSKHLGRSQLFRLFDTNRPIASVPVDVLGYTRQSATTGGFSLPPAKELLKFDVIVCTCSDANILYRAG